jgi:translation initiation factor 3 subunit D
MGKKREPSVQIKEDWVPVEGGEIEFNVLAKVSGDAEPAAEDMYVLTGLLILIYYYSTSCGTLEYYNKTFDLTSTKTDTLLERTERTYFNVTTSDDPIIRQLSMEDRANVFATDAILAQIMATTRSVLPWDILVHKAGSKLFFDKREGSNFGTSYFNLV